MDKVETISADDVVKVSSVEGVDYIEVTLCIDTGDETQTTLLSARQAQALADRLWAHSRGEGTVRHTTRCRVEAAEDCPTRTHAEVKP
jgi:hypothetical protein